MGTARPVDDAGLDPDVVSDASPATADPASAHAAAASSSAPSSARARGRPSIYDVAARASVSHMTVSRVLNDLPGIRATTRERVLQAIRELRYTRSSIAVALATRRAMRIGVVVDGPAQYGPRSTLRALESAARTHGYAVSALPADNVGAHGVQGTGFVDQEIDALCVIAPRLSSLDVLRERFAGIPIVVIQQHANDAAHSVAVDQRAGTEAAMQHLLGLGHHAILHLAGPADWFDARVRAEAWRRALEDAGLPARPPLRGDWSSDSGYARGMAADFTGVTAVFAANDQMALGLIHALADRGIRVPEDISVVGFDDLPEARHLRPALTTVRQDFDRLGRVAMRALLAAIEGRHDADPDPIVPELVVRASTAPRHGDDRAQGRAR
ncbi:MAG: substrate-binding domain-containing protein [Actinobacteria bacterium]|nr:substrate-binding domain-containing protein [Actinomycetota bacterium]